MKILKQTLLSLCISVLFIQVDFAKSKSSSKDDYKAHALLIDLWSDIYHGKKIRLSKKEKNFLGNILYRHARNHNSKNKKGSTKLIKLLNEKGSKDLSKIILNKLNLNHSKHIKKALGV